MTDLLISRDTPLKDGDEVCVEITMLAVVKVDDYLDSSDEVVTLAELVDRIGGTIDTARHRYIDNQKIVDAVKRDLFVETITWRPETPFPTWHDRRWEARFETEHEQRARALGQSRGEYVELRPQCGTCGSTIPGGCQTCDPVAAA